MTRWTFRGWLGRLLNEPSDELWRLYETMPAFVHRAVHRYVDALPGTCRVATVNYLFPRSLGAPSGISARACDPMESPRGCYCRKFHSPAQLRRELLDPRHPIDPWAGVAVTLRSKS